MDWLITVLIMILIDCLLSYCVCTRVGIGWVSSTLCLGALIATLVVYHWLWNRSRFSRLLNVIPGPKPVPFLGNYLDVNVHHDGDLI